MRKLTLFLIVLLALSASTAAQHRYEVTQLGTLGGSYTLGRAINASGQLTGVSAGPGNAWEHAFLYSAGKMTDLGSLGTSAFGTAINASAQVVGVTNLSTDFNYRAFLYSQGLMQDLGLFGGISSFAYSINDSGQITICAEAAPEGGAFLYSATDNSAISLTAEIGSSDACAQAINNSGEITGGYRDILGAHAFLLSAGTRLDIGPVGTNFSFGFAINNSGQVAGNYLNGGTERAFLYSAGKTIDIGDLGGGFTEVFGSSAINKYGQIVGVSSCQCQFGSHAFLYTPGHGMIDLNKFIPKHLGVTLVEAWGINDTGQIIVTDGGFNSFLLTPKKFHKAK